MTQIHISMSIAHVEEKLASFTDERDRKLFSWETFGISVERLLEGLEGMKLDGMTSIPHEDCTNRKPDGTCGGCPDPEEESKENI